MANQVDLTQARLLVTTAIMHVANNNPTAKLPTFGGLMALKSPSFQQLRNEIDPMTNTDPARVVWNVAGARPFPQIKVTYNPSNARSVQTTRTLKTTGAGALPPSGASFTTDLDIYYEPVDAVKKSLSTDLQASNIETYYNALIAGSMSIGQIVNENNNMIGRIAYDIFTRGSKDILPTLNSNLLTRVFANVGTNPAYPSVVTPTAAAPIVTVNGFLTINGLKTPDSAVWTVLNNSKDKARIREKPVLIGGDKWLEWFRLRDIQAINHTSGTDYQAMYAKTPVLFYYDSGADTVFGDGVGTLIEPNTCAFIDYTFAGSPMLANGVEHNEMYYTSMNAVFSQFNPEQAGFSNIDASVSLRMDLRIKESNGTNAFPVSEFVPSVSGGFWKRPTGFLTTDTGDVFKTYTGIMAIQLT